MKVGYFQFNPEFGQPSRHLERVEAELSGVNADLIVLPELAFTGYYFEDRKELTEVAEEVAGSPIVASLSGLCKDNDGIHYWSPEYCLYFFPANRE